MSRRKNSKSLGKKGEKERSVRKKKKRRREEPGKRYATYLNFKNNQRTPLRGKNLIIIN